MQFAYAIPEAQGMQPLGFAFAQASLAKRLAESVCRPVPRGLGLRAIRVAPIRPPPSTAAPDGTGPRGARTARSCMIRPSASGVLVPPAPLTHGNRLPLGVLPPTDDRSPDDTIVLAETAVFDEVTRLLDEIAASWQPGGPLVSSRRWHRMRWEQDLPLVPLDAETEQPVGPGLVVRCRDISRGGISFVHDDPLPYRKVALLVSAAACPPQEPGRAEPVAAVDERGAIGDRGSVPDPNAVAAPDTVRPCDVLIVRLSWCRFTRTRRYLSGGPFLRREAWPAG